MEVKDLTPIDYANQRVMTYAQVAEAYNCSPDNIRKNFSNARQQFIEGVHYFKLEGGALREFKDRVKSLPVAVVSPSTTCLYLWTKEGCVRHCKMLNTQKAWDMFGELERVYFCVIKGENPTTAAAKDEPKEEPKKRKPRSDKACAYAMKMSNQLVKIGHTGNIEDRISRVENESGWQVTDEHHSPELERTDARRIERTLHRKYAHVKVKGEYFNADFDDVSDQLDREVELIEETICLPAELTDYERGKLLIELIGVTAESPFKEQLARQTANLLFGKEIF